MNKLQTDIFYYSISQKTRHKNFNLGGGALHNLSTVRRKFVSEKKSENRENEGNGVNIVHMLILLTKKLSRLSAFILFDMGYTNSM